MSSLMICQGCLSHDRKLTPIEKHEKLYEELLLTKPHKPSNKVLFCWECKKTLENVHKFRLKITSAQKILNSWPLLLCDSLSSITRVTKVNDYMTIIIEDDKERIPIDVEVDIKHENEDPDDKFEINNDDRIDKTEHKEEFNEIPKDEMKLEDNTDYDDIVIGDLKKELDEDLVNVLKKKKVKDKQAKQKKRVGLKMKYKTIIMKDITQKDKKKFYSRVEIDSEIVKQWMERKKQQTSKKRFQCQMCYCGFSQQKFYDQHMAAKHEKRVGRYECDICSHRFPDRRALTSHVRGHYELFVCKLCDQAFYTRSDIYIHLMHGPHGRLNECRQCGLRFDCRKRSTFYEHYRTMHMQFICDFCGKKCVSKKKLARHIGKIHTELRCNICDKSYSTIDSLTKHNRRVHEVDATEHNYCVECNMQFINSTQYTQHLKFSVKHRPNPTIPCPDCGKIYTKKSNMTNHYDLVHRKKTKHYCALCDTYYLNGFRLRYHQKYFHEKRPKVKNKICSYCGKGFSSNRILENHIRTHTGERPFACEHCPAAFAQKQALTSHMKSAHK